MAPALLALALLLGGCGKQSIQGDTVPNAPPETRVTGTPPALEQTSFAVRFYWTGSDPDGRIDHFEWRISDNGRDGRIDRADTLELQWHPTAATDSTFQVQADIDSLGVDVADPRQGPGSYRAWQTHTFFVRSVDDAGVPDPTPATVSFTATTLTPTIEVDVPTERTSTSCVASARVLTFGWTGRDPDALDDRPAAVRYLLHEVPDCYTQVQYERERPLDAVPEGRWSPWIAYGASQDSGRVVTLPRQEQQRVFFFAVQARDVAGAVTPTLEWGVNVRHVVISDGNFPLLRVTERFLGSFESSGPGNVRAFEVVSGQPLEFSWIADASAYAGIIEAYRYGFEVRDVNDVNDPGWAVPWGNSDIHRRAGLRSFTLGSPNFVVQVRDNSGTVSRAIFQLDVIQIERREQQRNLLLVQDWPRSNTTAERALGAEWDLRWERLLLGEVPGFDTAVDVMDTHDEPAGFSFRRLNAYKSVIYFNKGSSTTQFHAQLAPISTTSPRYNWFEIYQARVGNVLICGPRSMYTSIESNPPVWLLPIPFNTPEGGDRGFGLATTIDGQSFNRGTQRYPYTAWCLEAIDSVRPPFGSVYGEHTGGAVLRNRECDAVASAILDPQFLQRYPSATGELVDLRPTTERTTQFDQQKGYYQFEHEEFYNTNTTARPLSLNLRACQTTMFRLRARRDAGLIPGADSTCVPRGRPRSTLDLVPIAVASSVYADSKPLVGTEDFLWGFHPLAFQASDVQRALLWILRDRWQLRGE